MIVRCEECETRFRLDESRIPERGARVRCSRCNHSFIVRLPSSDASDSAVAQALAKDASTSSQAGGAPAPEPGGAPPSPSADAGTGDSQTAETESQAEEEDDWEFGPSEADVPSPPDNPPAPDEAAPSPDASASASKSLSDLLDHEDGVDRALAAAREEAAEPTAPAEDAEASAQAPAEEPAAAASGAGAPALDTDAPFAESGADLSGLDHLDEGEPGLEGSGATPEDGAPDPNADSLAAIGDPSSWNLLADEAPAPERPAAAAPPSPPPPAPPPSHGGDDDPLFPPTDLFSSEAGAPPELPAAGGRDFLSEAPSIGAQPAADESEAGSAWMRPLTRVVHGASWPLALALAAIASLRLLGPIESAPAQRRVPLERGFEIRDLDSHVVENSVGGPLLVVSGGLRNTGNRYQALEAAVAVTLLGTEGQRFDEARVLMGPSPHPTALRELDPAHLQSQSDYAARSSAHRSFAPGEERSFSAVFEGVPGAATRFSVALQEVRAPTRPHFIGPPADDDGDRVPEAPRVPGSRTAPLGAAEGAAPIETATALPLEALPSPE